MSSSVISRLGGGGGRPNATNTSKRRTRGLLWTPKKHMLALCLLILLSLLVALLVLLLGSRGVGVPWIPLDTTTSWETLFYHRTGKHKKLFCTWCDMKHLVINMPAPSWSCLWILSIFSRIWKLSKIWKRFQNFAFLVRSARWRTNLNGLAAKLFYESVCNPSKLKFPSCL